MKIKNKSNEKDIVTIRESDDNHPGLVRLNIGTDEANPRHVNLNSAEAKAVAYALLSYAEQASLD